MKKILFIASEAAPLVKTGGLGDVVSSLPATLKELGHDVRLVLPAYRTILADLQPLTMVATIDMGLEYSIRILQSTMPDSSVPVWLIDSPTHFDRDGGPYIDINGDDWPDNAERFTLFSLVAERIALNQAKLNWQPDIVNCNDWQTGLVPALLAAHTPRPATVFTIHNLAYQGIYSHDTFKFLQQRLQLPERLWSIESMEFHGMFSFMKGGLIHADILNTVSPTYAEEICTTEFGYGLEGLLTYRREQLFGILNGTDYTTWNPATDPYLHSNFDIYSIEKKLENKKVLQNHFKLPIRTDIPMLGMVGRLVEQKGCDLVLAILDELLNKHDIQFVVLGSGEKKFESAFSQIAKYFSEKIAVQIGFSEKLAHRIEGGCDMFIMPSRFEPCGLNQLYSLRYGTVPIVRRTGGLADTVIDADVDLAQANGFSFSDQTPVTLLNTIERALLVFKDKTRWTTLVQQGMNADYSWNHSAQQYVDIYDKALAQKNSLGLPPAIRIV